jgi:hypothetical protein
LVNFTREKGDQKQASVFGAASGNERTGEDLQMKSGYTAGLDPCLPKRIQKTGQNEKH